MENFDLYKQVSAFLEKDIKNWSYINTIEVLLNVAEGFQNENGLMAEKAAEKKSPLVNLCGSLKTRRKKSLFINSKKLSFLSN
jgi:hypothetical protein